MDEDDEGSAGEGEGDEGCAGEDEGDEDTAQGADEEGASEDDCENKQSFCDGCLAVLFCFSSQQSS